MVLTGDGNNAGNVGIGTTNPTVKLEVNGTIKATDLKLGSATLTETMIASLGAVTTVTTVNKVINLDVDDIDYGGHVNKYAVAQDSSGATTINSALNEDIKFKINNDSEEIVKVTVQLSVLYTTDPAASDEDYQVNLPVQFRPLIAGSLGIPIDDVTCTVTSPAIEHGGGHFTVPIDIEIENASPATLSNVQVQSSNNLWTNIVGAQVESAQISTQITTAAGVTAITIKGETVAGVSTMGDVGIGTTSPTGKLHVVGTIKATDLKLGGATLTEAMISTIKSLPR